MIPQHMQVCSLALHKRVDPIGTQAMSWLALKVAPNRGRTSTMTCAFAGTVIFTPLTGAPFCAFLNSTLTPVLLGLAHIRRGETIDVFFLDGSGHFRHLFSGELTTCVLRQFTHRAPHLVPVALHVCAVLEYVCQSIPEFSVIELFRHH